MEFLLKQMSRSKNNKRVLPADGAEGVTRCGGERAIVARDAIRGRLLAIDYGERRIGLAISDPTRHHRVAGRRHRATRRASVRRSPRSCDAPRRSRRAAFVIGLPLDGNGDETPRSIEARTRRRRARRSARAFPVELVDERYTHRGRAARRSRDGRHDARPQRRRRRARRDHPAPACAATCSRSSHSRACAGAVLVALARRSLGACGHGCARARR